MIRRRPHPWAWLAASLFAFFAATGAALAEDRLAVVVYPGYGAHGDFVLEGRVIEERRLAQARASDSWAANLWRNLRRLVNEEEEGVGVTVRIGAQRWSAVSDEEGYFRIEGRLPPETAGWQDVTVEAAGGRGEGHGAVLAVPAGNAVGVISDVDDTVLVSDVSHKGRLLANTLLNNPLQRRAVPGTASFYRALAARNPKPEAAPIFYLSASPRQLQANIEEFLEHNGFPRGVVITKRLTGDPSGEPLLDQRAYKGAHIEAIFRRLPEVRFVLVGDDGEQDPETYWDIQTKFPQRVLAVWIRRVSPQGGRAAYPGQEDLATALQVSPAP
jgi:phosphatidate phosphatase APP1